MRIMGLVLQDTEGLSRCVLRSNLFNMRLFYVRFQKIQTVSGQLTWSHYLELLKCDDPLELQFYMKECIKEAWNVRELNAQRNRPYCALKIVRTQRVCPAVSSGNQRAPALNTRLRVGAPHGPICIFSH